MSSEQFVTPNFERPPQPTGTSFENNDVLRFRASKLSSVEQARAALTAAMYAVPSGLQEAAASPNVEQQRLTLPQQAERRGEIIEMFRTAYQNDNVDLSQDKEITQDMFGKAA